MNKKMSTFIHRISIVFLKISFELLSGRCLLLTKTHRVQSMRQINNVLLNIDRIKKSLLSNMFNDSICKIVVTIIGGRKQYKATLKVNQSNATYTYLNGFDFLSRICPTTKKMMINPRRNEIHRIEKITNVDATCIVWYLCQSLKRSYTDQPHPHTIINKKDIRSIVCIFSFLIIEEYLLSFATHHLI